MKYYLRRRGSLICATLIGSLIVGLYLPAIHGPFLLDDFPNLYGLAYVKYQGLFDYILNTPAGGLGRPLSYLTFYFQSDAWPTNPAPFKLFNVILHAVNSILVMLLAAVMGRLIFPKYSSSNLLLLSALAGLGWGVLAIHTSTVLYVVQRMTSLSATFTLLGMISYVLIRHHVPITTWQGKLWLVAAALLGYAGVFAKESGILFGWYVVLLEWWVIRSRVAPEYRVGGVCQLSLFTMLFVLPPVLAFIYVIFTSNVFGFLPNRDWNWSERWITETVLLWDYMGRILAPRPSSLNLLNDDVKPIREISLSVLLAGAGWLLALLFSSARSPVLRWIGFAGVWFWVGHALESTFLPLELSFEHRNYLPSLAIIPLAIGVWLFWSGSRSEYGKICAGILLFLFFIWQLFVLTEEVRAWKDRDSFTATAVLDRPRSTRANQMLAEYLVENSRVLEAAKVIDQLHEEDRNNPGFALQLLYLQCFDSRVETPQESELLLLLREGKYTSAAEVIDDIRELKSKGSCTNLSWPAFRNYVNTLMSNRDYNHFRVSGYRIIAYSYFHEKNYKSAMAELDKWADDEANLPYLMVKVNISAHMGDYNRALRLIDLMRYKYDNLSALKRLEYKEMPIYLSDMEERIHAHTLGN